MDTTRKLWFGLGALLIASFGMLLWMGRDIHLQAPPLPQSVVSESGHVLYTHEDLEQGRVVWQSIGGQQSGSIWGHGALLAPDWSAEWLHREIMAMLDLRARSEFGAPYATLDPSEQAKLQAEIKPAMRTNTYDPATGVLTVSDERAQAITQVAAHYESVFSNDPATAELREAYALRENPIPNPEYRRQMTGFFFWASWATSTDRPGAVKSYTNNFPHEPLIGNVPTATAFMWSMFSILFMIAGIALLAWHYAVWHGKETPLVAPATDPTERSIVTPSMRATAKYFWLVMALFLVQILFGATTAHYQIEGQEAYGLAIADFIPYTLTRSWHTQLAILWIATAWLATGLYLGPAISGHEPKYQRLGVNFLFGCLIVIVVGAFAGQWFAVMQQLGLENNFWFGHQGWEYTDIGRFWQIFLFIGLMLWLLLMGRALWPALRSKNETASISGLLFLSTVAIALLYAAGLMWREDSSLSMITYWRFWIVHLWVEGFFEVFAVAVISFIFVKLGLVRGKSATINVLFATIVFMAGGVLGMFHHLYFAGVTTGVIAAGADRAGGARDLAQRSRHAVDATLQVADHVLPGGEFLEPGGRRPARLPGQHAAGAVLHAGHQPHRRPRPHGTVRRVRDARHRADAVLPARHAPGPQVAQRSDQRRILVLQPRVGIDDGADAAADGRAAAGSQPGTRLLVRALGRIHGPADHRRARVAAGSRRHRVRGRRVPDHHVRGVPVAGPEAAAAGGHAGRVAVRSGEQA